MSPENTTQTPPAPKKPGLQILLGWRLLALLLLLVIVIMLAFWKPWQAQVKASDRTISVTGSSTITAEPDEFVFSPTYDFTSTGTDKKAAIAGLTSRSNEIVATLKGMGVPSNKIKTNADGYNNGYYLPIVENGTTTDTLSLTITIDNKDLAQKVQDYLVSTSPTGQITPDANFSDAKNKQLESQGRDQATKDARAKADQSAKNLGFKVAGVKTVNDGSGFGSFPGCGGRGVFCASDLQNSSSASPSTPSLSVQPGENKLDYSVTVVYYIH
jgi:uncharacterized protein YggE